MKLKYLALVAGLLPILSVNLAYLIAVVQEHVPACFPYIDGCTTISSTGRRIPESLFFRATMIPSAVFLWLYWIAAARWLNGLANARTAIPRVLPWLGVLASLFLVLYTVSLGLIGDAFATMRRIGVTVFFASTYFAQLLYLYRIQRLLAAGQLQMPVYLLRLHLAIAVLMLLVGLFSSARVTWLPDYPDLDNVIEWNFGLLMYLMILLSFWLWRSSGFELRFFNRTKDGFSRPY